MDLLNALRDVVGPDHVITDSEEIRGYATDWRGRYSGEPLCVVRPGTVDAVAGIVRECAMAGVAMVPQGGNTGLCGGATPLGSEVLVSLIRLNQVRWLDPDNRAMAVDAGCTLHQVRQAAAEAGLLFPLSLAAEGSATIGGNLSTNAGGVQVLRYGTARSLALGLEVVLPDGRCWDGMRELRKDNTGYDLRDLFIGAEGTLGFITGAVLKLLPQPRSTLTAWVTVPKPAAAVTLLRELMEKLGDTLSAFELIDGNALDLVLKHIPGTRNPFSTKADWQVLLEISDVRRVDLVNPFMESLSPLVGGLVIDAVIAKNEAESATLWSLRENISEAQRREGVSIKHDISLPGSRIVEFLDRAGAMLADKHPGLRIVCFGHLGDGNLHYNLSRPVVQENAPFIAASPEISRCVHDLVNELGGSISAEHGLGQLKREEILRYKSEVEMDLMRALKQAVDPRNLMNPGKVI